MVRIKSGTEKTAKKNIRRLYEEFNEGSPFEYKFLDEDYQVQYTSENKISILSRYLSVEWWYFACAGFLSLLVAWIAIATQIIIAVRINPVKYLKE